MSWSGVKDVFIHIFTFLHISFTFFKLFLYLYFSRFVNFGVTEVAWCPGLV